MAKKFYITTPIYYVNDVPHVGHAYTTLAADVIARYCRQKLSKENVFFLTGTDEHGANVAQAAAKHGKTPKEYADEVSPRFQEAWKLLDIEPDYFIRTTDPRHKKIAQEVLQKIYDKGYIYSGDYEGWYCIGCEKFLTESDLIDGKCPLHPTREPVYQKEKNYFLKLKELSQQVLKRIEQGEYHILPEKRHNEIVTRVKQGVEDISISRAGVSWGIPVPWDKTQTIYVWVEALFNYYTATQFIEGKQKFWPPNLHLMAKDILWFHSVIWQALLIAAGLELPKTIFAHGFFTIDGQKMSKSLGNVISPEQLVNTYGVDGTRYLLLSAYQFGSDGDLSLAKFTERYNADLANGLGNLIARTAKVSSGVTLSKHLNITFENVSTDEYKKALEQYRFQDALAFIWEKIKFADKLVDDNEPWKLKGKDLEEFIQRVIPHIQEIATLLLPFLPQTAEKILEQFKGPTIVSQPALFPRIQ
ncbi:methionine--tRNA ligase [Candidatus Gottesmanbacteria bacterium]|nr:methionine--tRNA ligase [Candidatus Gottesmanbacteria bacterium]